MKNYKKGLLTLSILSIMPFVMANTVQDLRIKVTTFADENGENLGACSLREALKAAEINQSYGGCSAGQVRNSVTDAIVLEKGEYILTRPLITASQVVINGVDNSDWSKKDPITGAYPATTPPASVIKGNNTFSLIDNSLGLGSLALNNLTLSEGGGRLGGAIHAGVSIALNNVHIKNSNATEKGGAIYLTGSKSALSAERVVFENNQAPQGSVLAMTCVDNLRFSERNIILKSSSILNNGGANTQTIIEFCGNPAVELINNTITKNVANGSSGSVLKFTGDSRPNTSSASILSDGSSLLLENNTIVDNSAYSTFLYDSIAQKTLTNNIIGYNKLGFSCRHLLGKLKEDDVVNLNFNNNAVNKKDTAIDYCDLPYKKVNSSTDTNTDTERTVDLSKFKFDELLFPLQIQSQYAPLPVYFLKNIATNPLRNHIQADTCTANDQLNNVRNFEGSILADKAEGCDIGAIEYSNLTVKDLTSSNGSLVDLIKSYETERDFFKSLINDSTTNPQFIPYYKIRHQEEADKVNNYPKTFKYRVIYFDVFSSSQPQAIMNNSGVAEIKHLDSTLYNVTTESLGIGPDVLVAQTLEALPSVKDPNLKCEWNESISKVLMYRTDGLSTQAGDYAYCKYTIALKSDPTIKSTGILQANFINIAPVAVNDSYSLQWGTDQRVRLDLLANDHDHGDGKPTDPFYPKDKKSFYVDASGISAPIKLGDIDSSLHFEAQYEAPCPDESGSICYGGEMYIQPKNSFNKFNYSFTYQVFDADGAMSNAATVNLINTATTTDDTRGPTGTPNYNAGKSGGGSVGLFSLFGLIGLVALRRKYIK